MAPLALPTDLGAAWPWDLCRNFNSATIIQFMMQVSWSGGFNPEKIEPLEIIIPFLSISMVENEKYLKPLTSYWVFFCKESGIHPYNHHIGSPLLPHSTKAPACCIGGVKLPHCGYDIFAIWSWTCELWIIDLCWVGLLGEFNKPRWCSLFSSW